MASLFDQITGKKPIKIKVNIPKKIKIDPVQTLGNISKEITKPISTTKGITDKALGSINTGYSNIDRSLSVSKTISNVGSTVTKPVVSVAAGFDKLNRDNPDFMQKYLPTAALIAGGYAIGGSIGGATGYSLANNFTSGNQTLGNTVGAGVAGYTGDPTLGNIAGGITNKITGEAPIQTGYPPVDEAINTIYESLPSAQSLGLDKLGIDNQTLFIIFILGFLLLILVALT